LSTKLPRRPFSAASRSTASRIYATDFHNARVEMYDARWHRLHRPGAFVDHSIPEWYAPFGVQVLEGHVFVTYVWRAPGNGNDAPTGGYVDEFDRDGRLLARVARKGPLNAPWGMALAPRSFGRFGGDLLVGNFGDGQINAYAEKHGRFEHRGTLRAAGHGKLTIDGLWALEFGNSGSNGDPQTLFFTAGPNDEADGLFGTIKPAS